MFHDIQQAMRGAQLEEKRRRELASALHIHFKDWLYGNIKINFEANSSDL